MVAVLAGWIWEGARVMGRVAVMVHDTSGGAVGCNDGRQRGHNDSGEGGGMVVGPGIGKVSLANTMEQNFLPQQHNVRRVSHPKHQPLT